MGAGWFRAVMDYLPIVTDAVGKLFPSNKALGAITSDPEGVKQGRDSYDELARKGAVSLYKQKITSMDKATLKQVVLTFERNTNREVKKLSSFKMLIESATGQWVYESNAVEHLEVTASGTNFLFYKIYRDSMNKYNLAICHLQSNSRVSTNVLIGGLISEGLLARDSNDQVYLTF